VNFIFILLAIAAAHTLAGKETVAAAQVTPRWLSQKSIPSAVSATNPVYQAQNLNAFEAVLAGLGVLRAHVQPHRHRRHLN
jgi:hypothetical protein